MYHWRFETHILLKILTCLLLLKSIHLIFLKFIIKKIDLITYFLKIHGNTCELHFWSWHYHPIRGPIQNMEAMFQTWKNVVFQKDLHLGPTNSFYCDYTLCWFDFCWVNVFVVGAKGVDITHHMPWGLKIQTPTWILIKNAFLKSVHSIGWLLWLCFYRNQKMFAHTLAKGLGCFDTKKQQ